jgi:hypothetical protein
MKCPQCAYDNAEDALSCNLCQFVLRKAPPKAAPPAAGGEPPRLDSAQAISALILAALAKTQAEDFPEAERIMARLYAEVDRETCRQLLGAAYGAWAQTSGRPKPEIVIAGAAIEQMGAALVEGNLSSAQALAASVMPTVAEITPDAFRLSLLLLGLVGAAKRGVKPFAGPPPGMGAPPATPPPAGGGNKASW